MEVLIILLVAITGVSNILCFLIGAKTGQAVSKGEEIKMPTVSPMKLYREHKEHEEAEREQKRLDIILHNIECYDGTDAGQKDIPR